MAFTEQNKADAYLFFVLAFNAAPGTVYGGQIVEAYESGMTTADIVAQYVTKDAFKAIYPESQTSAQFAVALVSNVASLSTSATVKAAAEADIVSALAAGWTKAQVVTQILGNLANKTTADADWGYTVAQLNNKIAVAKALTEGEKALNTTDVATLSGPLASVTEDVSTVQAAINGAGAVADKIDALNAANKAQADFWTAEKVAGSADILTKFNTAAAAAETALGDTAFSAVTGAAGEAKETVSAATQSAIVAAAKQKNADAVAVAKADLDTAKTNFLTANPGVSKAKLDAYLTAKAADAAAAKVVGTGTFGTPAGGDTGAVKAANDALSALNTASGGSAAIDTATGTVADAGSDIITVQSGKLALDAAFVAGASAAELTAAQKLLDGIVAYQSAVAAKAATTAAAGDATTALGGAVTTGVDTATTTLTTAQDKVTALDKALKDYDTAAANLAKDTALVKAISDAEDAFTDAGQSVPSVIDAGVLTTSGADVFLVAKASNNDALSGFAADDKIYVGKTYVLSTDVAKGDDAKLEVFFKANGTSTDVYIEQKAFGSNSGDTTGTDLVKITLTGVAADKLVLKDGFITVAA